MSMFHGSRRRETRRKNFLAKELHDPRFGPRIVKEKRQHKLDELHERETEEELLEFLEPNDEDE